MKNTLKGIIAIISVVIFSITINSCGNENNTQTKELEETNTQVEKTIKQRLDQWKEIELTSDVSSLSDNQKQILGIFIEISSIVDDIFWKQNFGDKNELLSKLSGDTLEFVKQNFGPWDILEGKKSVIPGYPEKTLGANFYPSDIKYLPFIGLKAEGKLSPYTLIRRDDNGDLNIEPYNEAYSEEIEKIVGLLMEASDLCENKTFSTYLKARAEAMLNDKYFDSDVAWMEVKNNKIDFLVGPVETRLDNFLHIKAAFETFILIRNEELSEKANKYAHLLSDFQQCLPIDDNYKEQPLAENIEFGVYDAVYYGGISNYGGKMLSLNRPYDMQVLKKYGSRKMMFKNVMDSKLEYILLPIAKIMLDSSQVELVSSEAFSETNLMYEIADKLGFNKTLSGDNVNDALKDYFTVIDKVRADIVRLYLINKLAEMQEIDEQRLKEHYLTYVANIFRVVRFGDEYPEAKACMVIFNQFLEEGAISRINGGKYTVHLDKVKPSIDNLTALIHKIEQDGDYQAAKKIVSEKAKINETLKEDLNKIREQGVPIDVKFKQGKGVLGL